MGIVHPLELAGDLRQAWLADLADYDVAPPFPQLERPAVTVKETEIHTLFGENVAGTTLNGMTFKGGRNALAGRAVRCATPAALTTI